MKKLLTLKILKVPVWLLATLVLIGLGGAAAYLSNQPVHAGWRYGACRAWLDHYVRFPESLIVEEAGENSTGALLVYSEINPFGSRQVRVWECYYSNGPDGRVTLARITVDRKALPAALVEKYAAMLPTLAGVELDTALPKDLPEDLEDLKE